jgi:hypothetical protein
MQQQRTARKPTTQQGHRTRHLRQKKVAQKPRNPHQGKIGVLKKRLVVPAEGRDVRGGSARERPCSEQARIAIKSEKLDSEAHFKARGGLLWLKGSPETLSRGCVATGLSAIGSLRNGRQAQASGERVEAPMPGSSRAKARVKCLARQLGWEVVGGGKLCVLLLERRAHMPLALNAVVVL